MPDASAPWLTCSSKNRANCVRTTRCARRSAGRRARLSDVRRARRPALTARSFYRRRPVGLSFASDSTAHRRSIFTAAYPGLAAGGHNLRRDDSPSAAPGKSFGARVRGCLMAPFLIAAMAAAAVAGYVATQSFMQQKSPQMVWNAMPSLPQIFVESPQSHFGAADRPSRHGDRLRLYR